MYDHAQCPPIAHDRDPGTALDDGQPVDEHGMLLCRDCGAPLMYCMTFSDYDHVDPDTPACFLVSNNGHAVEAPEYLAYLAELEANEERRRQRAGKTPPLDWGTKLDDNHYFCVPCWLAGFEDGAHSYEHPPCEHGPFDPR